METKEPAADACGELKNNTAQGIKVDVSISGQILKVLTLARNKKE